MRINKYLAEKGVASRRAADEMIAAGRITVNGKTAERFYRRFDLPQGYPEPIVLPSTSPANAAWSLDRLTEAWRTALAPFLEENKR